MTTLQILVRASDRSGAPEGSQVSTTSITVNVPRDQNPPRFANGNYNRRITENAAVNSSVVTVQATDSDLVVSEEGHIDIIFNDVYCS